MGLYTLEINLESYSTIQVLNGFLLLIPELVKKWRVLFYHVQQDIRNKYMVYY